VHGALWEFKQQLREWLKHGHTFKNTDDALESINKKFYEILDDENVDLN
jgi:hypothetical protein